MNALASGAPASPTPARPAAHRWFHQWAGASLLLGLGLAGCASRPPPPDWAVNAHDSLQRGIGAYLSGDAAVAESEIRRARLEVSRTGRPDALARTGGLCAI